ncbi:MAG: hypothetical protein PHY92_03400 [Alphaproteobacteria bacterium]|nr:hypothetical protein [Alphaproteobacteria bacterium]
MKVILRIIFLNLPIGPLYILDSNFKAQKGILMKIVNGIKKMSIVALAVMAANIITSCGDNKAGDEKANVKKTQAQTAIGKNYKIVDVNALYPQNARDGRLYYERRRRAVVVNEKGEIVGDEGGCFKLGNKIAVVVDDSTLKNIGEFLKTSPFRPDASTAAVLVLRSELGQK